MVFAYLIVVFEKIQSIITCSGVDIKLLVYASRWNSGKSF